MEGIVLVARVCSTGINNGHAKNFTVLISVVFAANLKNLTPAYMHMDPLCIVNPCGRDTQNKETEKEKITVKMVDTSTTPCQIKAIPLVHMRGKRQSITRKPSMNRNSNVSKISSSSTSRSKDTKTDTNQDVSPVIKIVPSFKIGRNNNNKKANSKGKRDITSSPSTTTLTRSSSMSSLSQDSLVSLSEMEAMNNPVVKSLLSDFDKQHNTTTTTPSQTKEEELLSVVPTSIITTQLNEDHERRQQVLDQVETQSVSSSSKPIEFSLTESNISRAGMEEKKEETYEESSAAAASSSSSEVFVPEWMSKSLRQVTETTPKAFPAPTLPEWAIRQLRKIESQSQT